MKEPDALLSRELAQTVPPPVERSVGARAALPPLVQLLVVRLATAIGTLIAASFLIFVAVQSLPGDVAQVLLGRNATPDALARVREALQLDRPIWERYLDWMGAMVTGDWGMSTVSVAQGNPVPVSQLIATPLMNSLVLAMVTLLILVPVGLGLGTIAAIRPGRVVDQSVSGSSLVVSSLPEFLLGTLLIFVFFNLLGVLPPISRFPSGDSPLAHPSALVLPVVTLLAINLAFAVRLVRAATIDVLQQDYVSMARLQGLKESVVIMRYGVRNSLPPSVLALSLTVQYLLGGVVITENVFAYPGIGSVLVTAVTTRDIQTVTVIAALLATAYVAINIIADVAVILLVPQLRTRGIQR